MDAQEAGERTELARLGEALWALAGRGLPRHRFVPLMVAALSRALGPCTFAEERTPAAPPEGACRVPLRLQGESLGELWLLGPPEQAPSDPAALGFVVASCLAHQRARWALGERVKELTCLYEIAQLADGAHAGQDLERIARRVAAAWQFPEAARGRVVVDGVVHGDAPGPAELHVQAAPVVVEGVERGRVEVAYVRAFPQADEGPFLRQERSLIDEVARRVAALLERRRLTEEQARLEDRLHRSERLAGIGTLAAGVAHEINEPLGSILGYTQLVQKTPGLPEQAARDLERIVKASLHARQIVRSLLVFARRVPLVFAPLDLNVIVREVRFLIQWRFSRAGVELEVQTTGRVPIEGDATQLQQVLVNLLLNALHSMPDRGRVRVWTAVEEREAVLGVEDDGTGMTPEVAARVFDPFFTTREVGQGTGLGLAVVHGIVEEHHGTIRVETAPGRGSRFEVRLPCRGAGGGQWR